MAVAGLVVCAGNAWGQNSCLAQKGNWQDFRCRTLSPGTILWPAASATRGYIFDHTDGYSSRPPGWAHRFGVSLGDNVDGKFMSSFLMPALSGHHRENYRYIGAGQGAGLGRRMGHAAMHTLLSDPDAGWNFRNLNWSAIPASAASTAVSNVYRPAQEQTFGENVHRLSLSVSIFAMKDFASEFLCGVNRWDLHKLATCTRR
jgi:hypothetical protein